MFTFNITSSDSNTPARTGIFTTPHGKIRTPVFMPVGTKGVVKTLTPDDLENLNTEIILANAYHLTLRPGAKLIDEQKGLHTWMRWNKPILTDSGGYQIFSLAKLRKINDRGAVFQSPLNGDTFTFTPENVIDIQEKLGADIIMSFDECTQHDLPKERIKEAMERTHMWLERGMKVKKRKDQALFPIIQGGLHEDLRLESAKFCSQFELPGIAIGGLSVGESKQEMYHIISILEAHIPREKPRYLMGVGMPEDILETVEHGIDMFDCVHPTRMARHGSFWNENGTFNLRNSSFRNEKTPPDPKCRCYTCVNFSTSYLRHLVIEQEITALRLLTIHNLAFLLHFMQEIRNAIQQKRFRQYKEEFLSKYYKK